MNQFYKDNGGFIKWGSEHVVVLFFILCFGLWFLDRGKQTWSKEQGHRYVFIFCLIMIFFQLFKPLIRLYLGNFSKGEDLPLHLCNLMPFAMAFAFSTNNRNVWAVFFFWIMGASSQSFFTPTLTENLPHYEALRYWVVHGGIVIVAMFGFYCNGWSLYLKDILISAIVLNVIAALIYPINLLLSSNYFYLNGKPPGTTLYSILPAWPTYILCLEGLMVVIFGLVYFVVNKVEYSRGSKT